jgi:hypothetical protein
MLWGGVAGAIFAVGLAIFALTPSTSKEPAAEAAPTPETNLTIKSNPSGATVYLNGKNIGITTEEGGDFDVTTGKEHNILVRKSGFADYTVKIVVPENSQRIIDLTLTPENDIAEAVASETDNEIEKNPEPEASPKASLKRSWGTTRRMFRRSRKKSEDRRESPALEEKRPEVTSPSARAASETTTKAPQSKPSSSPVPVVSKKRSSVPLLDKPKKNKVPLLDDKKKSNNGIPLL